MAKVNLEKKLRKLEKYNFRSKDLTGADFRYTDIRGANFRNAILKNADFSYAKSGQPMSWSIGLVCGLLLVLIINGAVAAFGGLAMGHVVFDPTYKFSGVPFLTILTALVIFLIWRGLRLIFISIVISIVTLIAIVLIILVENDIAAAMILASISTLALFVNAIVGTIILGSIWLIAKAKTFPLAVTVILSSAIITFVIRVSSDGIPSNVLLPFYAVSFGVTAVDILLCMYLAWKSLALDSRYSLAYEYIVKLSSWGGTCFNNADLTGVNFSHAILEKTDLREANLSHIYWRGAKSVDQARTDQTYLEDNYVRELVVTLNGVQQNFDGLNLRFLNLQGANLQNTSFIGSDLSEANLSGADLTNAKLARTQLYQTDLSYACLTGACIQDWGISTNTRLDDVSCEFVHMRLNTPQNPDPWRKPDNRSETFQPGDFTDFITPIIKTLDLYQQQYVDPRQMADAFKSLDFYHHDGIDPTAVAIALKQLKEENPQAALEIVALDGRGSDKIRLQAKVSGNLDRSKLSKQYFEKYRQAVAMPYGKQQTLMVAMAEKDERIQSLETMLKSAIKAGESYIRLGKGLETQKILILSANPNDISQRRLAVEVREIKEGLQRAQKRDQFEIISKWAVRPEDLRRALLDYEPQIVHFSGYGTENEGLALENELGQIHFVTAEALANLFEIFKDKVECVFLNACYSTAQAEAICKHIHYVIGMNQSEEDEKSAVHFAVGFYDALGAGRTIEDAFKFGHSALEIEGLSNLSKPVLKRKDEQQDKNST